MMMTYNVGNNYHHGKLSPNYLLICRTDKSTNTIYNNDAVILLNQTSIV